MVAPWWGYLSSYSVITIKNEVSQKEQIIQENPDEFTGEIPTREDVEKILRSLHGEVDEEVFKAAVVATFTKEERTLNPNWWEITKKNLIEWSRKG